MVASWMPSSPEEWTATPSWKVSHTPAALMQGRMPPQKVVSSRITSTAGIEHVGGQLLEIDHDRVGGDRDAHGRADPAHAVQAPDRVLVVVVAQVLDRLAEADRLLQRSAAFGS